MLISSQLTFFIFYLLIYFFLNPKRPNIIKEWNIGNYSPRALIRTANKYKVNDECRSCWPLHTAFLTAVEAHTSD